MPHRSPLLLLLLLLFAPWLSVLAADYAFSVQFADSNGRFGAANANSIRADWQAIIDQQNKLNGFTTLQLEFATAGQQRHLTLRTNLALFLSGEAAHFTASNDGALLATALQDNATNDIIASARFFNKGRTPPTFDTLPTGASTGSSFGLRLSLTLPRTDAAAPSSITFPRSTLAAVCERGAELAFLIQFIVVTPAVPPPAAVAIQPVAAAAPAIVLPIVGSSGTTTFASSYAFSPDRITKISRSTTDPLWARIVKETTARTIAIDFYASDAPGAPSLGNLSLDLPNSAGTRLGTRLLLIGRDALPTGDPAVRTAAWSQAPAIHTAVQQGTPLYLRATLPPDRSASEPTKPMTFHVEITTPADATANSPLTLQLVPKEGAAVESAVTAPTMSPSISIAPVPVSSIPNQQSQISNATKDAPFTNGLGMKFVPVPETKVLFCIHETRNADYAAYAESSSGVDTEWEKEATTGKDQHPVVNVSWEDAQAFCKWLSVKEGKTYRLPSDAEWSLSVGGLEREDASASPESKDGKAPLVYPWGGDYPPTEKDGNYDVRGVNDGYNSTAPVMKFKVNNLGVYDMGGNVWEWCEDNYSPTLANRVLRGASWFGDSASYMLSSRRLIYDESYRDIRIGFRCVLVASVR